MEFDKSLISGSNAMLVLSLLKDGDKYGYEMVQELKRRSNNVFSLKEGTLYPLLHRLEKDGSVSAYEEKKEGRVRRYYRLTRKGGEKLRERTEAWETYSGAVNAVLCRTPG